MQLIDNNLAYFTKTRIDGFDVIIRNSFSADLLPLNLNESLETVACSKYAEVFKADVSSESGNCVLFVKRHLYRSFTDKLKHLFRASRSKRSLAAAAMLSKNGFNSPKIVAVAEKRSGLFCVENILVTEELTGAKCIYDWEKDFSDTYVCPADLKRRFARELGRTIGKLHAKNISHGDLRCGNIFASKDGEGWRFYFLDNERTRQYANLPMKLRVKNLVQVNMLAKEPFGLTDRIRFFKEYMRENPGLQGDEVQLLREVTTISRRRMKKIFRPEQRL